MNLNNSSHANEALGWAPGSQEHTRITLYSVLLVLSLIGNVLVIAVVYCNQNLKRNMSNYLIVSMAVSDLLIPLVVMPFMISRESVRPDEWLVEGPLGEALCKLVPFLSQLSPYVSSFNLVIIAFQRFIAIVYPTRMHILTCKTRWILISCPWIVAMALFSPLFYIFRLTNKWGYKMCVYSWTPAFNHIKAHMIFMCIIATLGFLLPLIAITILYTIMQYKLHKSLNNVMEGLIETVVIRSRQRRNRRIMNMAITIILMFTVCWCPLGVLQLLGAAEHHSIMSMDPNTLDNTFFALSYLWYFLAAINPCIYFLFLRDFRKGLKKLCYMKTALANKHTLCVCCVSTLAQDEDQKMEYQSCTQIQNISTTPEINMRCTRTPSLDSNQDPFPPPHINTTSV